jgi:hypothetical protein
MMRATCRTARIEKTSIDIQKPSRPEALTVSSPLLRPAATTWKLVIMSLPWKVNSTDRRTPTITESRMTASHSQTRTLSAPVK